MRELNENDILTKNVDTIAQYHILDYLKKNLNINEFKIYLIDSDYIKVVDKKEEYLYFHYDSKNKEVTYQEELIKKEQEYEIGI